MMGENIRNLRRGKINRVQGSLRNGMKRPRAKGYLTDDLSKG
jgi:hypothetical protein